jgi:hypothetical protein
MDKFEDLVPEERAQRASVRVQAHCLGAQSVQASRWPVYDGGGTNSIKPTSSPPSEKMKG